MAQRLDGIEAGSLERREVTEDHPTAAENGKAIGTIPPLKTNGTFRTPDSQGDPDEAAEGGKDHRLDQELDLSQEGIFVNAAKDGNNRKVFAAEEWLAVMCSHVPNHGEQMVRYYGWYSNVLRGKRRKNAVGDVTPCLIESDRAPPFSGKAGPG